MMGGKITFDRSFSDHFALMILPANEIARNIDTIF
jgi:hypothetical protein